MEFVLFPRYFKQLDNLSNDDLVVINGIVARTRDKYQVNIEKMSKV